ncbi:MAG: cellobiose phosphorylase [Candidatus Omnitrophica bacterium]|nr:cellobiose phosphorylase [Candidatus Omnitrophota bacterium]
MIYTFIDNAGTFRIKDPARFNLYFPLTNRRASLLSAISPRLSGDIKKDNEHYLTPPASIEDLMSNLLCRREFFLAMKGRRIIRLSRPLPGDVLEAGFLYHSILKRLHSLRIEVLNFIPFDLDVEVMQVTITNTGQKPVRFEPTSFIPLYGRSERNLRDHRHVSSLLNRISLDAHGIYLNPSMVFDEKAHTLNSTIYFALGCEGNGNAPRGQFPTLDYFCGESDVYTPDAVMKNTMPVKKMRSEFNGKEACAAFRFRRRLVSPGSSVAYILIMGIACQKSQIKKAFLKLNSRAKVHKSLDATKAYWQQHLSSLRIDFKDRNFTGWLRWVQFQPTLRKLFGCSFLPHFDYGKGGRGWRDIWQDTLALLLTEPRKARELILNNFKGVRIDGSNATIITSDNRFIADRNRISRVWMDHGIWPYLTTGFYIHKTGDLAILLKEATYFKDAQLNRAGAQDLDPQPLDYTLRTRTNKVYRATVFEHLLLPQLVQFFNVGRHNAIRLENADWNDALDMAAENGESVAFTFMFAYTLNDACIFLERLKEKEKKIPVSYELLLLLDRLRNPVDYSKYLAKQKRLKEFFKQTKRVSGKKVEIEIVDLIRDLREKANHLCAWLKKKEWLREGFFNGYYDNRGRRVEGVIRGNTRMMLATCVCAIMSGVATDAQIKKIWASIKTHLYDTHLKGFRLNTDFGGPYLDLGRAFGFSYGDKENGAFFSHMTVMLANALYKRGFSREGGEVFRSLYAMATAPAAKIYPMLPEYFNGQGQGLYFYLTGSASWFIYTLIDEIFGIHFRMGDVVLKPKLQGSDFYGNKIEVLCSIRGASVKLVFQKKGLRKGLLEIRKVTLNGEPVVLSLTGEYIINGTALVRKPGLVNVFLQ